MIAATTRFVCGTPPTSRLAYVSPDGEETYLEWAAVRDLLTRLSDTGDTTKE